MKRTALSLSILISSLFMIAACKGGKKDKNELKDIPGQQPVSVTGMQQDTVEFPSGDGLMITAIVYEIDSTSPVIVLCHQARMSNYEYAEIAPKLNQMGFNCLAADLRSGGSMDAHENETF